MNKKQNLTTILKWVPILLAIIFNAGCGASTQLDQNKFLTDQVPSENPLLFKKELTPVDKLIHKGVFSPDLDEYYYTLSDKNFEQFDVYMIRKTKGKWSESKKAFFNTEYSEHGMSFSPDGNTMYFSSTRPTNRKDVVATWHIWKTKKINGNWSSPEFVDIPNLRDKLTSHPTVTNQGALYFHASNPDYSQMDLYRSYQVDGQFGPAELVAISMDPPTGKCTPHISADEKYLIFATIGNELELHVSFNNGNNLWTGTKRLNELINNQGQGNPYVTPDHEFLFFTTGDPLGANWQIRWVKIKDDLTGK